MPPVVRASGLVAAPAAAGASSPSASTAASVIIHLSLRTAMRFICIPSNGKRGFGPETRGGLKRRGET